jgi:hypothetical protein
MPMGNMPQKYPYRPYAPLIFRGGGDGPEENREHVHLRHPDRPTRRRPKIDKVTSLRVTRSPRRRPRRVLQVR